VAFSLLATPLRIFGMTAVAATEIEFYVRYRSRNCSGDPRSYNYFCRRWAFRVAPRSSALDHPGARRQSSGTRSPSVGRELDQATIERSVPQLNNVDATW